jgi:hypothetical protein
MPLTIEEVYPMVDDKRKILELKQMGYGYKKIAKELNLTLSVVRYACSKISEDDPLGGNCEQCHIQMKSTKGRKDKRFCSDKCRWKWWNQHQGELNKRAFYTHKCRFCNKEFTVYAVKERNYCCHECYIKDKINKRESKNGTK